MADVPLPEGARLLDELPFLRDSGQERTDLLIIDVGSPGNVESARLQMIEEYAVGRRGATRPGLSLALLGDVSLLASPEHVVWLRADGVWPSWPSLSYAEAAIRALRERGAQRNQWQEEIRRYQLLCNKLKIGAFCTTHDGSAFVWADQEAARILGYETVAELLASGRSPREFFVHAARHDAFVEKLDNKPASISVDFVRADRSKANVRIIGISSESETKQKTISGFLHDFTDLVDDEERQRLARLLDQLGFAYFAATIEGRPTFTSQKDSELLEWPAELGPNTELRERWWVNPQERSRWLAQLLAEGKVTDYPVLLRTYRERSFWVDADCRVIKNNVGEAVGVEGIYRDATARRFAKKMSEALSSVGASDEGVSDTAETICKWAASLFDAPACAMVFCDMDQRRVFPAHVWLASGPWSGPQGASGAGLILDETIAWLEELPDLGVHSEERDRVLNDVRPLFDAHAESMHSMAVIPLCTGTSAPEFADPNAPVDGYLWIPITRPLTFSEERFDSEFSAFMRLCSRQIYLAASRDASELVHKLIIERSSTAGIKELDTALGRALEALQARVPMEGCSIFRTGIEDRRTTLQLVSTSGLIGPEKSVTYELGTGLSGHVALGKLPRISFDRTNEPEYSGTHVERTAHQGQTWMGIPMLDQDGHTIGLIRCVNRLIGARELSVTGFSALDRRVVQEFARACALLIELSLLQEERRRTLARITHEIRTPTIGIRNNVNYLASHMNDGRASKSKITAKLADLELDAQILLNLLSQVDMVQGRTGNPRSETRVQTNVASIFQKTLFQLTPELNARNISHDSVDIVLHTMPDLWLPKAAVAQIVFNLFTNALKYSHPDPKRFRINIRAEATPHAFRIHFQDSGIGIDEAYRERIFEEEFRTPAARGHDARGLGLGLTISRKLAQGFGGKLTLESTSNPTDFVLVLPNTPPR